VLRVPLVLGLASAPFPVQNLELLLYLIRKNMQNEGLEKLNE